MTQEEKDRHEMELCGDLVPRLCEKGVWAEIDALDVQDTILVMHQAIDVLNKGLLDDLFNDTWFRKEDFKAAISRLAALVPDKLMAQDAIYTLIDDNTGLPFLDERGGVFLFSKEEYAAEALDYYMQQMRLWHIETVEGEDIYPYLGREFYSNGALYAVVDAGQQYLVLKPEDFIPRPDYSGKQPSEIPVSNPDYIRALSLLVQEMRWQANYEGKAEVLRKLEDDMIHGFVGARFLVPFRTSAPDSELVKNLRKGDVMTFAAEQGDVIPVFSDWDQFILAYDIDQWDGLAMSAEDLLSLPSGRVVLNVKTLAFAMSKQFMQQMFSIAAEG